MTQENIHKIIDEYLKDKTNYIESVAENSKKEIVNAFEGLLCVIYEIIDNISYINESKIKFKVSKEEKSLWIN